MALNEFYGSDEQLCRCHKWYLSYLCAPETGLPVLDLGCGSGVFLELLRDLGWPAVGVDHSDEAIAKCRAKGLSNLIQDDVLHHLMDKRECYASIFCCHLIEHFGYEDACRLLELSYQVLVPGGRMILVTPNPASLEVISEVFWLDPTHVRPYPLPLLTRLVERAGFEVRLSGQRTGPGRPRRGIPRRLLLRLLLGYHYDRMDSFVVGEKASHVKG